MIDVHGRTPGSRHPSSSPHVLDEFQTFYDATCFSEAFESFNRVMNALGMEPGPFHTFFPKLKNHLQSKLPYKYQQIWDILEKRSKHKVYGKGIAKSYSILVIGAGPSGLRTAIETQFLGAHTVVVEKRSNFTRNNVLKLWKFVVEDLKSLGIKSLFRKFCTGNINHISIKTLQLVLAKICLIAGIDITSNVLFKELSRPNKLGKGWTASFSPSEHKINEYNFNMLVDASGKKVPLEGFDHHSLNKKLCIAVTANFVNNNTKREASVQEIAGLSRQYHQEFFANIETEKGISLENIVYYKGETHYFVMTATRTSLLQRGVLMNQIRGDRTSLLEFSNVNKDALYKYAIDAAQYSTKFLSEEISTQQFALDGNGNPDVSVFDFTDLYCGRNASRVKVELGHKLIMACVGDSLLQPFWPDGTGCARGFLSGMNAAWMLRRFAEGTKTLDILAERENLYTMLKQTSEGPETVLKDKLSMYTIDPATRYKYISQKIEINKIKQLYEKYSVNALDLTDLQISATGLERIEKPDNDTNPEPSPKTAVLRAKNATLTRVATVFDFPAKLNRAKRRKHSILDHGRSRETLKRMKSSNI